MKKSEKEWKRVNFLFLNVKTVKKSEKEWKSMKMMGKLRSRFWTGFEACFGVSLKKNRARIGAMLFCCRFCKKLHIYIIEVISKMTLVIAHSDFQRMCLWTLVIVHLKANWCLSTSTIVNARGLGFRKRIKLSAFPAPQMSPSPFSTGSFVNARVLCFRKWIKMSAFLAPQMSSFWTCRHTYSRFFHLRKTHEKTLISEHVFEPFIE